MPFFFLPDENLSLQLLYYLWDWEPNPIPSGLHSLAVSHVSFCSLKQVFHQCCLDSVLLVWHFTASRSTKLLYGNIHQYYSKDNKPVRLCPSLQDSVSKHRCRDLDNPICTKHFLKLAVWIINEWSLFQLTQILVDHCLRRLG